MFTVVTQGTLRPSASVPNLSPYSTRSGVWCGVRLWVDGDAAALARHAVPEELQVSRQHGRVVRVLVREEDGRRDRAREAGLDERHVPDRGVRKEVVGYPRVRVDEANAFRVPSVRERRQQLQEKKNMRGGIFEQWGGGGGRRETGSVLNVLLS